VSLPAIVYPTISRRPKAKHPSVILTTWAFVGRARDGSDEVFGCRGIGQRRSEARDGIAAEHSEQEVVEGSGVPIYERPERQLGRRPEIPDRPELRIRGRPAAELGLLPVETVEARRPAVLEVGDQAAFGPIQFQRFALGAERDP
jgi:hypothetical protein